MIFMNRAGAGRRACQSIPSTAVPETPLYPNLPALRSFWLPAGSGHALWVEEWGRSDGIPALVLHGGPGSGCSPLLRRFFDPERFRVICPDQRGAGRSRPAGAIAHNTTADLLSDLQALRRSLGLSSWLVVGGSWGAALALAHALDQPAAVNGLLLRSAFLARAQDIEGFFRGAPATLAQGWRGMPEAPQSQAQALAREWWLWEQNLAGAKVTALADGQPLAAQVQRYRIQSHYLRAGCWLQAPDLPERCAGLPPVPTLLLHGTADLVCRPEAAQVLHACLPHSRLRWAEGAGHDPTHPRLAALMIEALDTFATHGTFQAELAS